MQVIGETGANKVIADYSSQFQHDFIQLLRTSHNTKGVHINHFYQQMISDKSHVHMVRLRIVPVVPDYNFAS
jgi:DNA/RNA-binding protein KIN17